MPLREFSTAPSRPAAPGESSTPNAKGKEFDPLRYCIFTTIAVLAWIVGPAVMATILSAVGLAAYFQARRAGLLKSRCILGDTRLVMVYLGVVLVFSAVWTVRRFL